MVGTVHLFDQLPLVAQPALARPASPVAPLRRHIPLVGVISNPRSHRHGGPHPGWNERATLLIERPAQRSELGEILAHFAEQRVDFLVVDGGDGTVRDVLTSGSGVFGESWPTLIVLPSGKTNALATDLGVPKNWSLDAALNAALAGRTVQRRPLVVSQHDNEDARVLGFVMGAGLYTTAIGLGQEAHRKGAFNSLAVGLTTGWTVLRALLGRGDAALRQPTRMRLSDESGRAVQHSGFGREDERYMLFASTLNHFPAGLRPFRRLPEGLRLAVMDVARTSLLLRVPFMVAGLVGSGSAKRGYHLMSGEAFTLDLGDRFILDGEAFPAGRYRIRLGPKLRFVAP